MTDEGTLGTQVMKVHRAGAADGAQGISQPDAPFSNVSWFVKYGQILNLQ